jgi:hypothetical protein
LTILLLAGCAAEAPSVVKTASSPRPPSWVLKVPQRGDTLYFSGAREGASSLEEGTDAAMQIARAHAAEFIGVQVSSEHRDVMSTDVASDEVRDTVQGRATAMIAHARLSDVYYEKYSRSAGATTIDRFDVWVLIELSRAELDAERARQQQEAKSAAAAALARLRDAENAERSGNVLAALARYRDVVAQTRSLPRELDIADARVHTSGQLQVIAEEALLKAQAKARRAVVVAPDWVAAGVIQGLSAKGFATVPQPVGSERDALHSARTQAVPWVIVVAGTSAPGGRVFNQSAATASLDVRALDAQSGAVAASFVRQEKGFGRTIEAALQAAAIEAGAKAAADLADALLAKEKAGF